MRRKLAALTGGLALVSAFTFAIPAKSGTHVSAVWGVVSMGPGLCWDDD